MQRTGLLPSRNSTILEFLFSRYEQEGKKRVCPWCVVSWSTVLLCAGILDFYSNRIMRPSSVTSWLITSPDHAWQACWWLFICLLNIHGVLVHKALCWQVDLKQQLIPKNHLTRVSPSDHSFHARATASPHEAFVHTGNRPPFLLTAFNFHLSENCHAEFLRTIPPITVSWEIVKINMQIDNSLLAITPSPLCVHNPLNYMWQFCSPSFLLFSLAEVLQIVPGTNLSNLCKYGGEFWGRYLSLVWFVFKLYMPSSIVGASILWPSVIFWKYGVTPVQ